MRIRFNSRHHSQYGITATPQNRVSSSPLPPVKDICDHEDIRQKQCETSETLAKVCKEKGIINLQNPILSLPFCTLYLEDILLLALILVLINENCNELLILALIYIFISGLEK